MKLINQSAEYLPQQAGIDGIYKAIELAGRTSYLSWDKMVDVVSLDLSTLPKNITADDIPDYKLYPKKCIKFLNDNKISYNVVNSSKKFVDMLIKSKHGSVLEHGTVYLKLPPVIDEKTTLSHSFDYDKNPYSKIVFNGYDADYVTTNLRVLQENGWLDDLKYLCEPTEFHEKRLSVKVITDIGVTREFNRHRTFSIVEQSTRYCNFSKDKFGNEIIFIKPVWFDSFTEKQKESYSLMLQDAENAYFTLLDAWENRKPDRRYKTGFKGNPLTPQQARQVLPLCTKTEVVYTAFESDLRHFFDLRLFGKTGEPHPQMKQLAELIKQEFEKAGVWEGIMKYPSKYD